MTALTPYFHGITIRDAAMLIGVPEANIRKWKSRGILVLTGDGQICPRNLVDWYDNRRHAGRARRGAQHQAAVNPYAATGETR